VSNKKSKEGREKGGQEDSAVSRTMENENPKTFHVQKMAGGKSTSLKALVLKGKGGGEGQCAGPVEEKRYAAHTVLVNRKETERGRGKTSSNQRS